MRSKRHIVKASAPQPSAGSPAAERGPGLSARTALPLGLALLLICSVVLATLIAFSHVMGLQLLPSKKEVHP
ncbi:hypothetical protein [Paracoccus tegillarcae]|uniref:hypothetical protein n=1 Tax=Paracoccus tegillarcae TaxID=1529068 RepID=UPI001300B825|nr:hypothetical protein [Paracoccus tegillarcae]